MEALTGKVALVTGGTRGIGREIALAPARVGANVAIVGRKPSTEADALVEQILAHGRKSYACFADLSEATQAACGVRLATASLGPIAILVNNGRY